MKYWTLKEIQYLREHTHLSTKHLAKELAVSESSVKATLIRHSIQLDNDGRFQSGFTPWNKGMKGIQIGGKDTQFKKGAAPHNMKPDGYISKRKDKSGHVYLHIKHKGKFVLYHRHIWEQAHGPIPSKHVVIFRDGDTTNVQLSNLEMITMAENAQRNKNPEKMSQTMKELWRIERLRKTYNLPPKTKLGNHLNY